MIRDPLALTGAVIVAVGVALPFVEVRPNRLVPGVLSWVTSSGPYAGAVGLSFALALLAALAPRERVRRAACVAAAPALGASLAWALGGAAERLTAGQPALTRVSLAPGAWVLGAAVAVLALAASALPGARARVRLAGVAGAALALAAVPWGGIADLSLAREYAVRAGEFWPLAGAHITLSAASLATAALLGMPLGLWARRDARARTVVLGVTGAIETIPSLALLGLLVVPLAALGAAFPVLRDLGIRGIGAAPGFIALTLYALLPIVRGTYVGLSQVDAAVLDAGAGMGMSRAQLLTRVEMPLAAPLVADGVRIAAVLVIGIATLTVFAGARNLGVLVFEGLGQFAPDLILLGALPTIALAVLADRAFGSLARLVTPKGVRA